MQVCVIKNTEPKRASLPLTGAFCGLVGYTLKHSLPIEVDEYNNYYPNKTATLVDRNMKVARQEAIENIATAARKGNLAADLFVRKMNAEDEIKVSPTQELLNEEKKNLDGIKEQIKNATPEIKDAISHYTAQVAEKVKDAKQASGTLMEAAIKSKRPTSLYVIPGVVLGVAGAFVYNVIGAIRE